ncbi:porin [Qipengyuania sp. XHP0207]|uniref:OprO/OprP family phosphate-selective porin n=1 Tax=Qipengyuania sp. XHP0207 TaxID=3038078 RepID=UPI00241ED4CF|nr:porin [Qipengyuania sp. XHP0207]MDG5748476.1 porin [Qipengyuania sp. XHP0207]
MTRMIRLSVAAAALSCTIATPVFAQEVSVSADELAAMRAQLAAMNARIDQLESELEAAKQVNETQSTMIAAAAESSANAKVASEAAPVGELAKSDGWSFKPRGRLQYDAGFVVAPDSTGREDGFGNDVRRARLGASGDLPGGFGYKFEVDFANSDVAVTDAIISYGTGDVEVSIGQFNNFQSLEELTSSLHTSFIERAAFTDAFGFVRRVGIGVEYAPGDVLLQAGVFSDNMDDLPNDSWSADGRVVYMPKIGNTQLHLGASAHYRELEEGGTVRYRQRPLVAFTSERFINTDTFEASSETSYGLEGAMVSGPFHAAAEGYWRKVATPVVPADPTFFGGYVEIGYFLTQGDTRGYKGGTFDRTKPENPVGEGGLGSLQINARYDRLDLTDAGIVGGSQDGYYLSLVWKPTDYVMLLANYGKLDYSNAFYPTDSGDRSYSVDVIGLRGQVDF